MNIAILYFTVTGNTLLACRYFKARSAARVDLFDICKSEGFDASGYHAVGLAVPTLFFGVPGAFTERLRNLPRQDGRPAFVFHTYGAMPGRTLRLLVREAESAGYSVFSGHSLHMPESYPPFIEKGWAFADEPGTEELAGFDLFIAQVMEKLGAGAAHPTGGFRPGISLLDRVMPGSSPQKARRRMGDIRVDESLCGACGACARACLYGAVTLQEGQGRPVFIPRKCTGCWACYTLCPRGAVYTSRMRGAGRYPGPGKELTARLPAGEKA